MSLTMQRGRTTNEAASYPPGTASGPVEYKRPVGAALTGATAVIAGAWGGLAGYIGPSFGYRPVSTASWDWSLENGLLHALPGAVAVAGGLMLMAMGPARRRVRSGALSLPALLLMLAGAWFVLGSALWPTFESSQPYHNVPDSWTNFLNLAGASLAVGVVLCILGGMAWKAAMAPAVPVEDPLTPAESGPVGATTPAAERYDRTEPGVARTEPGVVRTEPGGARTEPGGARTEPGVARTEPAVARTAPGGARTEPAVAREERVVEPVAAAPVSERTAPVADPAAERGAPVVERGTPVAERSGAVQEGETAVAGRHFAGTGERTDGTFDPATTNQAATDPAVDTKHTAL